MLKLLKHELIASYRQYFIVFLGFILACIIISFFPLLPYNIHEPAVAIAIIATTIIIQAVSISIILNFLRSMFKKPGYLSLTLPVSTSKLLLSKTLGALIWSTISYIILILGIIFLVISLNDVGLNEAFTEIMYGLTSLSGHVVEILQALVTVCTFLTLFISSMYFIITLVHTTYVPKYKTLIGIIGYIVGLIGINLLFDMLSIHTFYWQLSYTGQFIFMNSLVIIGILIFFSGTVYLINNKIEIE